MKRHYKLQDEVIIRLQLETYISRTIELIESSDFLCRAKRKPSYFTRKRKMPFTKLLFFMLGLIKESIQNGLERFFDKMKEDTSMTQQSFSEARQKIKWNAFWELFHMTANLAYEGYFEQWHGYRILAIDGSKIQLPSDEALRSFYGTVGAGNTSVTAQGSILYDVYNKVVVDALIEPIATDERTLALSHIRTLSQLKSFNRELILFDRGYASFELIRALEQQGIRYVFRVRRKFNVDIDNLDTQDDSVTLTQKGYESIPVRILKFELSSGETETLLTNIWDKRMGTQAFKELYFKRWPVETKYDELKNKLEIENFSGRTVDNIKQDFYVSMYMANIAAAACWEAQEQVEKERHNKDNKYEYHVNVNHEIGVLKDRFIMAMLQTDLAKRSYDVKKIISLLASRVTPFRPYRSVPRNSNPRNSNFHHNRKSNC